MQKGSKMRKLIFTLLFLSSTAFAVTPYDCKPLFDQQKEQEFVDCLKNICTGETEQEIRTCASLPQNQIAAGDFYDQIATKYDNYQNKPTQCFNDTQCSAFPGTGCFGSSPTDVVTDLEYDFVNVTGLFTGKNPGSKLTGQSCQNNSECLSFSCIQTASGKSCIGEARFCRKAQFGEVAAGSIECDDGLSKDAEGKCRTPEYIADRSRQLIRLNLNLTNANICNPDDPLIEEQFQRLKSLNFHSRSFETLFADSKTGDAFKMQDQLRSLAQSMRDRRLILVKKLNDANTKFKEEFLKIKTLRPNSQEQITFRGQTYTEADLYSQTVENGVSLDLMTDLENIRAEYNQSLGNLYLEVSDKFPPLIENFYGIRGSSKRMRFGSHSWSKRLFKLKNKRQWNYEVKLRNTQKKFAEEFHEGEMIKALTQIYPQFDGLLNKGARFKDFPVNFNTRGTLLLKSGRESRRWTDNKRLGWFPNRAKRNIKNFLSVMAESFEKTATTNFSDIESVHWDDLIDPELRFYTGCYQEGLAVPEAKNKSYCGQTEKVMKSLQSHMLAHLVLYGGTGGRRHYDKGYFDGGKRNSNQSNSNWIPYTLHSPRGNYLRYMYEAFLLLGEAYQSLADSSDKRIACINQHRMGTNPGGLFYSQYHEYNPGGFVQQGNNNFFDSNVPTSSNSELANTAPGNSGNSTGTSSTENGSNFSILSSGPSGNGNQKNQNSAVNNTPQAQQVANTDDIQVSSYTQNFSIISGNNNSEGFDWDAGPGNSIVTRSGSSLSMEEAEHVMKNLKTYEAPAPAQDTIFETISNSYVDNAYPAIFAE